MIDEFCVLGFFLGCHLYCIALSGLFGEGPADRRERLRNLMLDVGELRLGSISA